MHFKSAASSPPGGDLNERTVLEKGLLVVKKATLWIDTDTRQLLKIEATLPQMGGAKLTSELTK
ncbi:MAG: hypothetical protein ACRD1S_06970 [Vicinamibacterales bacterium]